MGRNRVPIVRPHDNWRVVITPSGQLAILDQDGHEPFRHPDRAKRIEAFFMASQAPPLEAGMRELVRIVSANVNGGFHGYRALLEFCHLTISLTKPTDEAVAKILPVRFQQDIDFESEAA